jgi:hypothetical protein
MTVQLYGDHEVTTKGEQPLVVRILATTILTLFSLVGAIASGIVAVVRQDLANGQIERIREDWER